MIQKGLKIFLPVILFLTVFSCDFRETSVVFFSAAKYSNRSGFFFSKAQAGKKNAKRKKKKSKKVSKKKIIENIDIPIAISGDDICRKNAKRAFQLLFEKDRENFELAVSSLGKIECAVSGSGVYPWENPPRFKVGVATYNASSVWYASVLVHESCHVRQFKKNPDYRFENGYSGEKAEKECLEIQLQSLKKTGAGQATISYIENISASRYWLANISERWW